MKTQLLLLGGAAVLGFYFWNRARQGVGAPAQLEDPLADAKAAAFDWLRQVYENGGTASSAFELPAGTPLTYGANGSINWSAGPGLAPHRSMGPIELRRGTVGFAPDHRPTGVGRNILEAKADPNWKVPIVPPAFDDTIASIPRGIGGTV